MEKSTVILRTMVLLAGAGAFFVMGLFANFAIDRFSEEDTALDQEVDLLVDIADALTVYNQHGYEDDSGNPTTLSMAELFEDIFFKPLDLDSEDLQLPETIEDLPQAEQYLVHWIARIFVECYPSAESDQGKTQSCLEDIHDEIRESLDALDDESREQVRDLMDGFENNYVVVMPTNHLWRYVFALNRNHFATTDSADTTESEAESTDETPDEPADSEEADEPSDSEVIQSVDDTDTSQQGVEVE